MTFPELEDQIKKLEEEIETLESKRNELSQLLLKQKHMLADAAYPRKVELYFFSFEDNNDETKSKVIVYFRKAIDAPKQITYSFFQKYREELESGEILILQKPNI